MVAKKTSKSQSIRDYAAKNPKAKGAEIAKALGLKAPLVYNVLSKSNKPSKRKVKLASAHVGNGLAGHRVGNGFAGHRNGNGSPAGKIKAVSDFVTAMGGFEAAYEALDFAHHFSRQKI